MTASWAPGSVELRDALVLPAPGRRPTRPIASTAPSAAPSTAISSDSHRTARRSWRRCMPTARRRPELTGPLVHRQGQRVGDADEGDHHGQGQQAVDQVEHLVDLAGDAP